MNLTIRQTRTPDPKSGCLGFEPSQCTTERSLAEKMSLFDDAQPGLDCLGPDVITISHFIPVGAIISGLTLMFA